MDQSKKLKTSDFADESSASSSSSSSGHKLRAEKMVVQVVKKEAVSSSRQIQKSEREKIRRDKLNEQFLELGNALDPKRPKSDKASTITDTIQMLKDLMSQVDKLKAEYATLSQESRELIQEKSELIDEKSSLKSDIEILNAQYEHRVRTMVPWIPHYTYPIPVVAITQNPAHIPIPCSTFIPYSASIQQPCSSSGASNKQDCKTKSLDLDLMRNSNHSDHKDDVGLELELKIHDSSSVHQDVSGKDKNGRSITTRSSSSKASVQDTSSASVNDILKS
uniref:Transcription factor bHLH11 n=1 Tax=Noccaea caerulescens TaxID=107243 RepID=A0A1J3I7P0_NOCCA